MKEQIKQLRKAAIILLNVRQTMCGPSIETKTAISSLMKGINCISNTIAELQVLERRQE